MSDVLADHLSSEGLQIVPVPVGGLSHRRAVSADHSLVVLGIVPPATDATDLLRRLQTESHAGILLVIAGGEELDGIIRSEVAADHCSPTSFSSPELVTSLGALVRGLQSALALEKRGPERIVVDDLEMDTGDRSVRLNGTDVELTALEFNILGVLVRTAGQAVTREQVSRFVFGRKFSAFDRSIDIHISKLRRKLGPSLSGKERIKSVRSVGYLYAASARTQEI
jgi:DNA-binding response OmpR family regulator